MIQTGSAKRKSRIAWSGWKASTPASSSINSVENSTSETAPYSLARVDGRKSLSRSAARRETDPRHTRRTAVFTILRFYCQRLARSWGTCWENFERWSSAPRLAATVCQRSPDPLEGAEAMTLKPPGAPPHLDGVERHAACRGRYRRQTPKNS